MSLENVRAEYMILRAKVHLDAPTAHYCTRIDYILGNELHDEVTKGKLIAEVLKNMEHLLYKNTPEGEAFAKTKAVVDILMGTGSSRK